MSWSGAFATWLLIIIAESVHGVMRRIFLVPVLGDGPSRQVGVMIGSAIILAIACAGIRWIGARSLADQLKVGLLWVGLTVAFEFGLGYLLGYTMARMLSDYDPRAGGLMGFGLVFMLLSPALAAKLRGMGTA